ncbi:MAG: SH3 domain-containing protein [Planctomycetota bacterium]|nr:MAG: SH3 domain-containing protein [Planctomycetota bacterium]
MTKRILAVLSSIVLVIGVLPHIAAEVTEQQGVAVETVGRANVRYGPSTQARVITTLEPGSEVVVYGPAMGREGWYTVAFPRQGHAWAHSSVLRETEHEGWYRVIRDGANVRSDSRITADLVTQLSHGELVEFKGRRVGEWLAIHPGAARAYMYHTVLDMSPQVIRAIDERALRDDATQRRWQIATQRYEYYRETFSRNQQRALRLNWQGLSDEFQAVVDGHPTVRTRLQANRLRESIAPVVRAANRHQEQHNLRPLVDPEFRVPEPSTVATLPPAQPERQDPPPATVQQPRQPTPPPPTEDDSTATTQQPPQPQDPQPEPEAPPAEVEELAQTALEQLESPPPQPGSSHPIGWLEQRDDPGIGTSFALLDSQGELAAFIRPSEDLTMNLSEFYWRRVEVQGDVEQVTLSIGGRERQVAVITATQVRLAD